jgi:hypothetical protein
MHRSFPLFLFFMFSINFISHAQDTIVLMNGKTIIAKNIEVGGYSVSYFGLKAGSKQKRVDSENVFSIIHADGREQIIYERDSLEENEFNTDQMRMFIKGEQDALKYYRNNLNKITAFLCGAGASYFTFYGIIGPAIYSTVVGSFSPDLEKQKVSNPVFLHADEYREGYDRKVRDKKIVTSIYYGLAGFAAGFAAFSIASHK